MQVQSEQEQKARKQAAEGEEALSYEVADQQRDYCRS